MGKAITRLSSGRWGLSILLAGTLGLTLGLFHFFAESRLEPQITAGEDGDESVDFAAVLRHLTILPRVGLGILLTIFFLMMFAARGL